MFVRVVSALHVVCCVAMNIFMISLHLPATLTGVSCDAQDHSDLRICRAAHLSAVSAYRLEALSEPRSMDCTRASVRVVLRARFVLDHAVVGIVHRRPYPYTGYRDCALLHQK